MIAVFWAFDGWVYITWVSGEVKDPQRNLPRSMILGLLLVGVIYLAINAVYLYALPIAGIAAETTVARGAAVSMFSSSAAKWLSLMIAVSCFGAMASCVMSGARVYYAMAEDGVFFKTLANVHPRWRTPVASLVIQGVWSAALALSGKYDQLFTYVMFMMVLSYVLTVVALFVLRRKQPNTHRPYRCAGYPWVPGLYVFLGSVWFFNVIFERPKEALAGIGIVALGMPFYFYWRRQKRLTARDGECTRQFAFIRARVGILMNFQNFELEYFQSQFERTVEYNLADSSVKCANVSDLLLAKMRASSLTLLSTILK